MTTMGFKYHSGPSRVIEALEMNTSAFLVGDLVYLNEGLVTVAADNRKIYGVALRDGSTAAVGVRYIPIQVITPNTYFIAEVDTTTATTDVGTCFMINFTSGSQSVDIGGTTTTAVRIEQLVDAHGTATGRVVVRFEDIALKGDT